MRVLLIDPWGTNNTAEYLNGLIYGLSEAVELTVCTNCYFDQYVETAARIERIFFPKSELMANGRKRTLIRGLEYIRAYLKILARLKTGNYDVVHINWLLSYKIDAWFLRQIKKYCRKVVYTAHNVLPHVNGELAKKDMQQIYDLVDTIIVHGGNVRQEMVDTFPETESKIYIQKHGCVLRETDKKNNDNLPMDLKDKWRKYKKVFLCCGAIFPNKGTDRIVRIWIENYMDEDALLVVGGRQTGDFPEYEKLKADAVSTSNIVLFEDFIEESLMQTLFSLSSVVVLPYRHASMSGVVFSAAQYAKPILCTEVGALPEYLVSEEDSIVCENTDEALKEAMDKLLLADWESLKEMGEKLHDNIKTKCDWRKICDGVVNNAYEKGSLGFPTILN